MLSLVFINIYIIFYTYTKNKSDLLEGQHLYIYVNVNKNNFNYSTFLHKHVYKKETHHIEGKKYEWEGKCDIFRREKYNTC
jgi:hypothetical protein